MVVNPKTKEEYDLQWGKASCKVLFGAIGGAIDALHARHPKQQRRSDGRGPDL